MVGMIQVQHFCEQISTTACVTACACMALRARGKAPDQRALHVDVTEAGRPLKDILDLVPNTRAFEGLREHLFDGVVDELDAGHAIIAEVSGLAWMYLPAVQRRREASGRSWDEDGRAFLHAIVLYAFTPAEGRFGEEELLCLDPFFPAEEQPVRISRQELLDVFSRAVVIRP